jgi:hypothetical protein
LSLAPDIVGRGSENTDNINRQEDSQLCNCLIGAITTKLNSPT